MLRPSFAVFASTLALALATAQDAPAPTAKAAVVWHQDFTAAREIAAKSGQPLFVTFRCER